MIAMAPAAQRASGGQSLSGDQINIHVNATRGLHGAERVARRRLVMQGKTERRCLRRQIRIFDARPDLRKFP